MCVCVDVFVHVWVCGCVFVWVCMCMCGVPEVLCAVVVAEFHFDVLPRAESLHHARFLHLERVREVPHIVARHLCNVHVCVYMCLCMRACVCLCPCVDVCLCGYVCADTRGPVCSRRL